MNPRRNDAMTNRTAQFLMILTAAVALLWSSSPALASSNAAAASAKMDTTKAELMNAEELARLAKDARTAEEHATVAKQYRLRGEWHEKEAVKHEQKVRAMSNSPIAQKWPAMAPKRAGQERHLAVEARRASQEAFRLAERHTQLAVEAGFRAE
jgi:hypothetical protein